MIKELPQETDDDAQDLHPLRVADRLLPSRLRQTSNFEVIQWSYRSDCHKIDVPVNKQRIAFDCKLGNTTIDWTVHGLALTT